MQNKPNQAKNLMRSLAEVYASRIEFSSAPKLWLLAQFAEIGAVLCADEHVPFPGVRHHTVDTSDHDL
jgi:hypothetical protein